MKYREGHCAGCLTTMIIVKRLPGRNLCYQCNNKRLAKERPKRKKKSLARKFKPPSGQEAVFLALWASRSHHSEISGEQLHECKNKDGEYSAMFYKQFSHLLPKGSYPSYKLLPENIWLITPDEHDMWHRERWKCATDPKWAEYMLKYDELKARYHLEMSKKRQIFVKPKSSAEPG